MPNRHASFVQACFGPKVPEPWGSAVCPLRSLSNTGRRRVLKGLLAAAAAGAAPSLAKAEGLPPAPSGDAAAIGGDASYWAKVQASYAVTADIINLENGYWGLMAEPVRREYLRLTDMVNRDNSFYARVKSGADFETVRKAIAAAVGAAPEEIAITRGATEALQLLIGGYNKLKPGDAVMYADLDYDSMQYAMNWLKERRGVEVVKFDLPEPASRQAVLDAYDKALSANPKVRLLLLTHLSHRTGLVLPVAEVTRMAKARGIDVIVDAAHSWGQIDFNVRDLGADFVGFNLHKWIGAPVGVGFLYIAKDRIADIDRDKGDEDSFWCCVFGFGNWCHRCSGRRGSRPVRCGADGNHRREGGLSGRLERGSGGTAVAGLLSRR